MVTGDVCSWCWWVVLAIKGGGGDDDEGEDDDDSDPSGGDGLKETESFQLKSLIGT